MYTGTLIKDLLAITERICDRAEIRNKNSEPGVVAGINLDQPASESEQFSQTLGLSAADGNLGLFLVVHPKLVGAFEPGNHFTNAVDIDEIRSVSTPE